MRRRLAFCRPEVMAISWLAATAACGHDSPSPPPVAPSSAGTAPAPVTIDRPEAGSAPAPPAVTHEAVRNEPPPPRPNTWGDEGVVPMVRRGETQVNGKLPPEVIERIVRQRYGRFRLCYEAGLPKNHTLEGRVTLELVINASGLATSAVDGGSDLPDASVVSCVIKAAAGLLFPHPEGGGSVTVVYPIIFYLSDPSPIPVSSPKPQRR